MVGKNVIYNTFVYLSKMVGSNRIRNYEHCTSTTYLCLFRRRVCDDTRFVSISHKRRRNNSTQIEIERRCDLAVGY